MLQTIEEQTIIAQCTPSGSGALALLRISGSKALEIVTNFSKLVSGKKVCDVQTHTIHFGYVHTGKGSAIDQVMFIVMRGPKTFTGEDVVEITCHNNPFLIEAIIQRAVECGARLAQPGEFSKRAYLNNKIDLVQAESINELIHASTQIALKQSLAQVEGSFSQWLLACERELLKAIALSEASFEFIDEEMSFGDQIKTVVDAVMHKIEQIKKTFNYQQHIRQGVRIALIGSVNAGKSSLFNALLTKKRSIVSDVAGTTRDVIEAGIYKKNSYWTLLDTAGLRETEHCIEQEGILRSYQEAHQADCIILVYDGSRAMTLQEQTIYTDILEKYSKKSIIVRTKADLTFSSQRLSETEYHVSMYDTDSLVAFEQALEKKIDDQFFNALESPFLLNKRHYTLLLSLEKNLQEVQELLQEPVAYELVSHHLKEAVEKLSEFSGKTITEQSMDAIFREFCVGK